MGRASYQHIDNIVIGGGHREKATVTPQKKHKKAQVVSSPSVPYSAPTKSAPNRPILRPRYEFA